MDVVSECLPCLVRLSVEAVRRATADESQRDQCLRAVLGLIAGAPPQPPPVTAAAVLELIRERTGCADPYLRDKSAANRFALGLLPRLRQLVREHPRPFEAACRLAVAGNLMDLGITDRIPEERVSAELAVALGAPFDTGAVARLEELGGLSQRTLWLCDNAGEVVLDRLLIERFPGGRVTVAVRGGPVLNDATRADALAAGLNQIADVIDNGTAVPGTVLSQCTPAFRRAFAEADLVVAKGQGNYETLEPAATAPVVFLMKVKCLQVSRHTGLPMGSSAVLFSAFLGGPKKSAAAVDGRRPGAIV